VGGGCRSVQKCKSGFLLLSAVWNNVPPHLVLLRQWAYKTQANEEELA